jgi:hypothetical protein
MKISMISIKRNTLIGVKIFSLLFLFTCAAALLIGAFAFNCVGDLSETIELGVGSLAFISLFVWRFNSFMNYIEKKNPRF